jgi:tetratricopeptide (TPR) repeat protein
MTMSGAKFWLSMLAFQIAFGGTVFALTRQYYMDAQAPVAAGRAEAHAPIPAPAWPDPEAGISPALLSGLSGEPSLDDPMALARQADELFANKQYDRAVDLYTRLLALEPDNVDTYNNLGLTLHYVGRSAEALSKLNEGIALNPTYQRIWLTTGFVNAQIGDLEQARLALSNAVMIGPDTDVGRSASRMLEGLGQ